MIGETMGILEEVEQHRKQIVTDSYTTNWRELLGQYKDGDLKIDPEYQRLFRWNIDQQTQFLESLLLGIPSPAIFLAENKDGGFEILDGLQRLSTLIRFFTNEIHGDKVKPPKSEEYDENDLMVQTLLVAGPLVTSLDGFTAQTLPETLTRTIKYSRITVIQIKRESDAAARMEVFRRLNRFGSLLSDQEIRNATARLHGPDFPEELRKISNEPEVMSALAIGEANEKRMGVEELILRLLALHLGSKDFKHTVSEFLDNFMIRATEGKIQIDAVILGDVRSALALIAQAIPDGAAFRFKRSGFSTNLFDVVAIGTLANLKTITPDIFKDRYDKLISSDDLKNVVGAGSNSKKKLLGRIELGTKWFS
jgi:Protein of unknown function DUF262